MSRVAGIDGCRGAWLSVVKERGSAQLAWKKSPSLWTFLQETPGLQVVGIDIPIGLPEKGPRACDLQARKLLGKRGGSVFPAPIRAVLSARDYRHACAIRYRAEGRKISKQTWFIVPKIRETDTLLQDRPELGPLLHEVHPEVSFFFMGDRQPNRFSKKKKIGLEERIDKLARYYPINAEAIRAIRREHGVAADDVVDALAVLWSAERIARGEDITLGEAGKTGPGIYA